MNDIPLQTLFIALFILLLVSGFFSIAETSMMALNRYRLRHLVSTGNRGAIMAAALLDRTDRLLGVVLLGNNFVNSLSAALFTVIMFRTLGENEWALWIGSAGVTFCILVLSEITPKIIGASYPERIALASAYVLTPLLRVAWPVVWFVNLFVQSILWVLRLKREGDGGQNMTPEELRTLVLEGGHYIPQKHRSILVNLFELERVTVDDVMIPRGQVEWLDLESPPEQLLAEIATCYHTRLVVCRGDLNNVIGILHVRRALSLVRQGGLSEAADVEALLAQPYFVPAGTALFTQLANFQEQHERIGLIVDEYGELQGLVTLEDILEEIVGPIADEHDVELRPVRPQRDGSLLVDGTATIRDLNRDFGWNLPDDEATTIAGLVLHEARAIPEVGQVFVFHNLRFDIVRRRRNQITVLRITPPAETPEAQAP